MGQTSVREEENTWIFDKYIDISILTNVEAKHKSNFLGEKKKNVSHYHSSSKPYRECIDEEGQQLSCLYVSWLDFGIQGDLSVKKKQVSWK